MDHALISWATGRHQQVFEKAEGGDKVDDVEDKWNNDKTEAGWEQHGLCDA